MLSFLYTLQGCLPDIALHKRMHVLYVVQRLNYSSQNFAFRTNLPKELMAFPDFPFSEHPPSFVGHEEVRQYLEDYAKNFDLFQFICVGLILLFSNAILCNKWVIL